MRNRVSAGDPGSDKSPVQRFWRDAAAIFETAEAAAGRGLSELTILTGREIGIRIIADSDWPLDRVLADSGAEAAYRVHERNGRVRMEARAGHCVCRLESESPRQAARQLLSSAGRGQCGGQYPLPAGDSGGEALAKRWELPFRPQS